MLPDNLPIREVAIEDGAVVAFAARIREREFGMIYILHDVDVFCRTFWTPEWRLRQVPQHP